MFYYMMFIVLFFFFKQKTAYEMRISDWSSDVCSSDLVIGGQHGVDAALELGRAGEAAHELLEDVLAVAQFFEDARVDGGVDGRLGRHALRGHLRTGSLRGFLHARALCLLHHRLLLRLLGSQIGSASCRERVCQDV